MAKLICLFRFHKHPQAVKERVNYLRKLNPGLLIVPLYGGQLQHVHRYKPFFKKKEWNMRWVGPTMVFPPYSQVDIDLLKDDYKKIDDTMSPATLARIMATFLKWRDGDLSVLDWFQRHGSNIDFTHAVVIPWDLIYTKPLAHYYRHLTLKENAFSQKPHAPSNWHVKHWDWLTGGYQQRAQALEGYLKERYGYKKGLRISDWQCAALSRKFLETYAQEDVEMLRFFSNDEVRLPSFIAAYGFKSVGLNLRNDFCKVRHSKDNFVAENFQKGFDQGITVFHPYRPAKIPPLL